MRKSFVKVLATYINHVSLCILQLLFLDTFVRNNILNRLVKNMTEVRDSCDIKHINFKFFLKSILRQVNVTFYIKSFFISFIQFLIINQNTCSKNRVTIREQNKHIFGYFLLFSQKNSQLGRLYLEKGNTVLAKCQHRYFTLLAGAATTFRILNGK